MRTSHGTTPSLVFLLTAALLAAAPAGAPGAPAAAQDASPDAPPSDPAAPVFFDLKVVQPTKAKRTLSWSPKGRKVPFTEQINPKHKAWIETLEGVNAMLIDARFGELTIGEKGLDPIPFLITRVDRNMPHHERLIIDGNRDGKVDPKTEVYDTRARNVRGRTWVSYPTIMITMRDLNSDKRVEHEFTMWQTYPKPDEEGDFSFIRITRKSWMEGSVEVMGQKLRVALIDANNDGRYTRMDSWIVVPDDARADRAVGDQSSSLRPRHACFIGDQAYRLMSVGALSTSAAIRLSPDIRPLETEPTEPARPKASAPLKWMDDLDAAKAEAATTGKRVFVKWTAVWCGPCHQMDGDAFVDKAVVDALNAGYICVKLDQDKQYKLAQSMRVRGLPTIMVLEAEGRERKRNVGFLSAADVEKWLAEAKDELSGP